MAQQPTTETDFAYLFTDVVDSVRHWSDDPRGMSDSLERHDEIVRQAIVANGGAIFSTAGDSFGAAFADCADAVRVAEILRRELAEQLWSGPALQVRSGVHVGPSLRRDQNYFGTAVNLAARLAACANGGQLLVSGEVVARLNDDLELVPLGQHRLRGIGAPAEVYQVGAGTFAAIQSEAVGRGLPVPRSSLIGRHDDARTVRKLMARNRLVSLTGPGGCGKTRLALEAAAQEAHDRRELKVHFVGLVEINDDLEVPGAFVDVLGLTASSLQSPIDQIVHYLADGSHLIVVDNCEHVIDGAAEILDQLLQRSADLAVLATTQEALEVEGEAVWRVPSLDVGPDSDSSRLFIERAAAANSDFGFDSIEQLDLVAKICARLEGAPLAIELAAARTATHSLHDIHDRLDERLSLLGSRRRRSHGRHRTLAAAVAWSYNLLSADEQRFLRMLSVFQGGFENNDAAAVAGMTEPAAVELLEALLAKSLVDRYSSEDGRLRFRLLETIRLFAGERRIEASETAEWRDRHLAHFLQEQASLGESSGYDIAGDWRRMREFSNLRSAIDHAVESNRPEAAVSLASRLVEPFGRRGEAERCLELLHLTDDLDDDARCLALATSGYLRFAAMMGSEAAMVDLQGAIDFADGRPLMGVTLAYSFAASVKVWSEPASVGLALLDQAEAAARQRPDAARDLALVAVVRSNVELALSRPEAVPERCAHAIASVPDFGLRCVLEAEAAVSLLWLDRVDEAQKMVESFCPVSPATSWGYFTDMARVGVQARAESVEAAARAWIPVSRQSIAQRPVLMGECLQMFAWFHWLNGDDERAKLICDEVVGMQVAATMAPLVIQEVNGWDRTAYEAWFQGKAERLADMDRLLRGIEIMPKMLDEEYARWS